MYKKTKKMLQDKYEAGIFPGVISAFVDGKHEEVSVLGHAACLPEKEVLTIDHLFDVASLTKVICTTSVILRYAARGLLAIDDAIQKHLPTFQDEKVTVRHLLTHTADFVTWIANRDQLDALALRQAYLGLRAGRDLGKKVVYTDAGTIILGFLIEEISGKTTTAVFQEEVLTPLKMNQSGFPPFSPQKKIVSTARLSSGEILRGVTHDPKARVLGVHAGNAGFFTTISDVLRFVHAYFEPIPAFLAPTNIQDLLQDQTPNRQGGRSLGWDLKGNPAAPFLFHTGYTGTFLLLNPQTQQAWIFLSNRIHPNDQREAYKKHREELIATYLAEIHSKNML
ncbi:serine hydrolase domain-containing protein [Enterococcus sp. LJL98]